MNFFLDTAIAGRVSVSCQRAYCVPCPPDIVEPFSLPASKPSGRTATGDGVREAMWQSAAARADSRSERKSHHEAFERDHPACHAVGYY